MNNSENGGKRKIHNCPRTGKGSYKPKSPKAVARGVLTALSTIALSASIAIGGAAKQPGYQEPTTIDIVMPTEDLPAATEKPYADDEEARKLALRLIADKISQALDFEQTETQRLYTKELTGACGYEIRFEYTLTEENNRVGHHPNGTRYTSLIFNSMQTKELKTFYKEIMKGGDNAWKIYEKIQNMNIRIDKDGNLSFIYSDKPQNEANYYIRTEDRDNYQGPVTVTLAFLEKEGVERDDDDGR